MLKYIQKLKLTVCDELTNQHFLPLKVLKKEKQWVKENIPKYIRWTYKIIIIPVVLLMKISPRFTKLVNRIAWAVWFNYVLPKCLSKTGFTKLRKY
jgi:hypothetical protein